jgi:hypothetical protein
VTFPVLPRWVCILSIVVPLLVGCMEATKGVLFTVWTWKLARSFGRPIPNDLAAVLRSNTERLLIGEGVAALVWWGAGAREWWKYRRWGRVPRVLTATSTGLVQTKLGWWRMRERIWPADQFTAVELRNLKWTLSRNRTVAILRLRRRHGLRLRFRLSSSDSQLPDRIAQSLATVPGCPIG